MQQASRHHALHHLIEAALHLLPRQFADVVGQAFWRERSPLALAVALPLACLFTYLLLLPFPSAPHYIKKHKCSNATILLWI